MNFWTFLDRNSTGAVVLVFLVVMWAGIGIPAAIHEWRQPPCKCEVAK